MTEEHAVYFAAFLVLFFEIIVLVFEFVLFVKRYIQDICIVRLLTNYGWIHSAWFSLSQINHWNDDD